MGVFKIQGQEVIESGDLWRIHIKKPIYGHCVAINSKLLFMADQQHKRIIVSCPGAEEETTAREWQWKAKRINKVFRIPNHPMVLYQAQIGDAKPEVRRPQEGIQLSLL
jgi:hypothetical protein